MELGHAIFPFFLFSPSFFFTPPLLPASSLICTQRNGKGEKKRNESSPVFDYSLTLLFSIFFGSPKYLCSLGFCLVCLSFSAVERITQCGNTRHASVIQHSFSIPCPVYHPPHCISVSVATIVRISPIQYTVDSLSVDRFPSYTRFHQPNHPAAFYWKSIASPITARKAGRLFINKSKSRSYSDTSKEPRKWKIYGSR